MLFDSATQLAGPPATTFEIKPHLIDFRCLADSNLTHCIKNPSVLTQEDPCISGAFSTAVLFVYCMIDEDLSIGDTALSAASELLQRH